MKWVVEKQEKQRKIEPRIICFDAKSWIRKSPSPNRKKPCDYTSYKNTLVVRTPPNPPTSSTTVTSVTSGTFRNFSGKTTTIKIKIGFYFFTYECCRRRLSLIKMIDGVDKALILLFTAFRYECLFWSIVVRAWIVRLFILEKIRSQKEQKEGGGQTKTIWREKCFSY